MKIHNINTLNDCLLHVCFENISIRQNSCSNILLIVRIVRNNLFTTKKQKQRFRCYI